MKNSIPLKDAVIAWTSANDAKYNDTGKSLQVFPFGIHIPNEFVCTVGAVFAAWETLTGKERYQCLLQEGWHLLLHEGFDIQEVHKAFLSIKEYSFTYGEEAA